MTATSTRKPQGRQLTPEEDALQAERGEYYKKLMHEVCKNFVDAANESGDKVGILLSGGVDSTVILWTLINLGVKPYVYTFRLPNKSTPSADEAKAEALAKHYGLPFRLAKMPDDPDELTNMVLENNRVCEEGDFNMHSRADFEVLAIMRQMVREAVTKDDVRLLFSGTGEGPLYFLGRKDEIRGRKGGFSINAMNTENLYFLDAHQNRALSLLAAEEGASICLANAIVANMMPYIDVPWHVLNTPRKKEITLRAYKSEEKLGPVRPAVMPLQCGSSGAREYYDDMIPRSSVAQSVVGRDLTSAIVLYNSIKKIRGDVGESYFLKRPGDWMDYINGFLSDMPEDSKGFYDPVEHRAIPPKEEVGIFGDIFADEDESDDEEDEVPNKIKYRDDPRIDCMGNPFWLDQAHTHCSYAVAGWATKPNVDGAPRHHITECSIWLPYGEANSEYVGFLGAATASQYREQYSKWAENVLAQYRDRKIEKIFPNAPGF